jgi:hypothetical protein
MSGLLSAIQYPGAPALLNAALGATGSIPTLQIADALGLNSETVQHQWGIYNTDGSAVVSADSCVDFNFKGSSEITSAPIEGGGFTSYNKVQNPYEVKMTLALSGALSIANIAQQIFSGNVTSFSSAFSTLTGLSARGTFLAQIEAAKTSLALVNIVTPDITYQNSNIVDYDYDRKAARGASLLNVEITLKEVRVIATSSFSNTQSPNGQDQQNNGPQQPSVTGDQLAATVNATGTN